MINGHINRLELELEIEAAPENITIEVQGKRIAIHSIDHRLLHEQNELMMLTNMDIEKNVVRPRGIAVLISKYGRVLQVILPALNAITLSIPANGFALLTEDHNLAQQLQDLFHEGDMVKLRNKGEIIVFDELMAMLSNDPHIVIDQPSVYTVTTNTTMLTGYIVKKTPLQHIKLLINDEQAELVEQDRFQLQCSLVEGANEITLRLYNGSQLCDVRELMIYHFKPIQERKQIFLWVEQGHNLLQLSDPIAIGNMLQQAKKAGVTDVVLDVKGIEGFASYKHAEHTGRPYVSCMTAPGRAGFNSNIDFLYECTLAASEYGIRIHAAFNVFAEGSYYRNEFALPKLLEGGGQQVLQPEDGHCIIPHQRSHQVKSGRAKIAYVNPANDDIRDFELRSIEEVICNYSIDGIILDRCRYDDEFADFSEVSRNKFAEFVAKKGKKLRGWPEDVFSYQSGKREEGPLLDEWWEFRAHMITSFVQEVRELVDHYNSKLDKKTIQLSSYVGSWYEYAYIHGLNWASPSFQYHHHFHWLEERRYTTDYAKTGYIGLLDFIIVGAYQQTLSEIEHYITLAHNVTDDLIPIIIGVALPYVQHSTIFPTIVQTALTKSSGLMLFDHCHIDWTIVEKALSYTNPN